jgi:hypothetical protein
VRVVRNANKILVWKLEGRFHSKYINVQGGIILEFVLGKLGGNVWTIFLYSSGSGQGPVAGSCEQGNENSGSVMGGEFLDQLSDC